MRLVFDFGIKRLYFYFVILTIMYSRQVATILGPLKIFVASNNLTQLFVGQHCGVFFSINLSCNFYTSLTTIP